MHIKLGAIILTLFTFSFSNAQEKLTNKEGGGYEFEILYDIEATSVKNQNRSGTCWSFSALSFFESELARMGKKDMDLSEMYVVRKSYEDKADIYVRFHGKHQFGPGGAFHDALHVIENYGMLPEKEYRGLNYGEEMHRHGELDVVLSSYVDAVLKNKNKKLSPAWSKGYSGILDAYLGEVPENFEHDGKEYTPESYANKLELKTENYVELSSFTHHPFYEQFVLKVPDNWLMKQVYNVKLDELIETIDHSLENGYGIAWAADVSEKGFSFRDGVAIVPENEASIQKKGSDNEYFSDAGAEKIGNAFNAPTEEKEITQEIRQLAYDNYETTDDHGMHITGIVKDQNGTKYYIIKNSWGTANDCDGYFYASEAYVRYKTIDIMVHKDAIPKKLSKKLNL